MAEDGCSGRQVTRGAELEEPPQDGSFGRVARVGNDHPCEAPRGFTKHLENLDASGVAELDTNDTAGLLRGAQSVKALSGHMELTVQELVAKLAAELQGVDVVCIEVLGVRLRDPELDVLEAGVAGRG